MKIIQIQYYAVFREARGLSRESLQTDSASPAELYKELGFALDRSLVQVAINGDFASMDQPLRDGDSIVFIPPVAGG